MKPLMAFITTWFKSLVPPIKFQGVSRLLDHTLTQGAKRESECIIIKCDNNTHTFTDTQWDSMSMAIFNAGKKGYHHYWSAHKLCDTINDQWVTIFSTRPIIWQDECPILIDLESILGSCLQFLGSRHHVWPRAPKISCAFLKYGTVCGSLIWGNFEW